MVNKIENKSNEKIKISKAFAMFENNRWDKLESLFSFPFSFFLVLGRVGGVNSYTSELSW